MSDAKNEKKAHAAEQAAHVAFHPSRFERFIGGDFPKQVPWCGFCCTLCFVLLTVVGGGSMFKISDAFGGFVLSDPMSAAFLAHGEFLKDRVYFTDEGFETVDNLVKKRMRPAALTTIFLEVKDTKCPGDDCDLKKKNAITPKYLGYISKLEKALWEEETFQKKYCALLQEGKDECRPPRSPLSLFLWGDGVAPTEASKKLVAEGFGTDRPECATEGWASPLDDSGCSSPAWTHVRDDSGAAEPGNLEDYQAVIAKLCTPNDMYWSAIREVFLPNFACDDNHMAEYGVPFLRSQLLFGIPYDKDRQDSDIDYGDQIEDIADDYGSDMFKAYSKITKKIMEDDDSVNVVVVSGVSATASQNQLQMETLSLTAASFLLVFLYMWFNVESLFLAIFGMLQVLFTIMPTVLIWHSFINQQGVQFLQLLAIFMILGIGADTVFVLNDSFKQHKAELAGVHGATDIVVFATAYRRAMGAMFATTMTTGLAFLLGAFNPIPVIADFCIFACIIVFCNFLYCVTFFAAVLAFQDKFMAGQQCCCFGGPAKPGSCCSPGCCFGMTRACYRACRGIKPDASSDQRALEIFFSGPLFHFVCRFRYTLTIFWLLALIAAGVSAATQVKIAEKDPEGLPADHPEQRFATISSDYFRQPEPEKVRILWGLSDDQPVSKWSASKGNTPETIEFIDIKAALSPEGQQKIYDLCTAPDREAGLRCLGAPCLVKGSTENCATAKKNGISYNVDVLCQNGRYCIMEQVKEYADRKGIAFPLVNFHEEVNSADFVTYMFERWAVLNEKKQHWHGLLYRDQTGFVMEDGKVKYMWMSFNATFEGAFLPPKEGNQIFGSWEDFVERYAGGTKFWMVHVMFLFKVLQDVIVEEAFKSIGCSLAVAFGTLCFVTWNWYVATLGLVNLVCILVYFLGLWPILGWELDIFNVIFCIMAVGLSVDYTVHLLHAFNECDAKDRESRVQHSLSVMGITVVSGATTTLMAAIPLFMTVPIFYQRFGAFIFICISLSILTSLLFLVPMLLVVGPVGRFGDIVPFYLIQEKIKGKPHPRRASLSLGYTQEQIDKALEVEVIEFDEEPVEEDVGPQESEELRIKKQLAELRHKQLDLGTTVMRV